MKRNRVRRILLVILAVWIAAPTGASAQTANEGWILSIDWSPDGSRIVTGDTIWYGENMGRTNVFGAQFDIRLGKRLASVKPPSS
jgi:hypothetical protein